MEQVAFEARESEYVDSKSGVSARMTISGMENLIAGAKLRLIESDGDRTAVRLIDFMSIIPSITGKIELVYEGEQEGADEVAKLLIDQAIITEFEKRFSRVPKLEKEGVNTPYTDIIKWFDSNYIELNYTDVDEEFIQNLSTIEPLTELMDEYCPDLKGSNKAFCMEMVIWSLAVSNKLDKSATEGAFKFDTEGLSESFFGNN